MAEGSGKPKLEWCAGCRLPYNVELSPSGCPRCAKNPDLAAQVRREREREERTGGFSLFSGPAAALGWIVAATAVLSALTSLYLWDVTSAGTGQGDDLTGARFSMVVSGLSTVTYAILSVVTFLGATLFAWIAFAVVVIDLLVNGVVAVSYHSQLGFYALAPKAFVGALLVRQLLKAA